MHVVQTMVSNDPGGRVTVTFLGENGDAVEVHMAGSAGAMQPQEFIDKAKVMLLDALAAGDGTQPSGESTGELSAAPMASEKRDPYASSPDDDDDNAYQSPDEALPNDREEEALDRDMGREATLFGRIRGIKRRS